MITRTESSALRGFAILGIVLHNYTHWLGPMVKENEYTFSIHNVRRLMVELSLPEWDLIAHLISFLGHYGVPIFLFLSAFGLVMKYESPRLPGADGAGKTTDEGALAWFWKHYKKLFLMMATGYAAFVMVDYMTRAPRHYEFWNVVGQLGMFSNLYADPDHDIWPGPYWYFGLMVQIYLLYRFVLYKGSRSVSGMLSEKSAAWLAIGLAAVLTGVQLFFEPEGDLLNWYRYNFMGGVLPFVCGLLYARIMQGRLMPSLQGRLNLDGYGFTTRFAVVLLSAFLVLAGSMYFSTWLLVPVVVCVCAIAFIKILPQRMLASLAWVGGISSAMFVSHPIARKIIIPISRNGDLYAGLILYTLAAIVLGILFRELIRKVSVNS